MTHTATKLSSEGASPAGPRIANAIAGHTNWFLANLPENDYLRLKADLEYVSLTGGRTLHSPGENFHHVYFPVDCLLSSLLVSREGVEVEVETAGAEGFVGQSAVLGARQSSTRSFVAIGGTAWRLPVGWFKEEFKFGGCLHDFALYNIQCQLAHSNQLSLCHRLHSIEERLCRWLLSASDAIGSNEIPLTHEVLAQLLGSRRPGITIAINILRQAGFIECCRGRIVITNHKELSLCSCECYDTIRAAREKSLAAMARRSGPMNCSRNLLSRQGDLLRVNGDDMREKSFNLQRKAQGLQSSSAALIAKRASMQNPRNSRNLASPSKN